MSAESLVVESAGELVECYAMGRRKLSASLLEVALVISTGIVLGIEDFALDLLMS